MINFGTKEFNFELVSPARKLVSEPLVHAVLPGEEGEFGVGAGHSSLLAALKPGIVKLFHAGQNEPVRIFIAGGFADVTGTHCTVLAEEAINVNDIDRAALDKQIQSLNEELARAGDEAEKARINKKLAYIVAKLQATQT